MIVHCCFCFNFWPWWAVAQNGPGRGGLSWSCSLIWAMADGAHWVRSLFFLPCARPFWQFSSPQRATAIPFPDDFPKSYRARGITMVRSVSSFGFPLVCRNPLDAGRQRVTTCWVCRRCFLPCSLARLALHWWWWWFLSGPGAPAWRRSGLGSVRVCLLLTAVEAWAGAPRPHGRAQGPPHGCFSFACLWYLYVCVSVPTVH